MARKKSNSLIKPLSIFIISIGVIIVLVIINFKIDQSIRQKSVNKQYQSLINNLKQINGGRDSIIVENISNDVAPDLSTLSGGTLEGQQIYTNCLIGGGLLIFSSNRSPEEILNEYNITLTTKGYRKSPINLSYFDPTERMEITLGIQSGLSKTNFTYSIEVNFADPSITNCSG